MSLRPSPEHVEFAGVLRTFFATADTTDAARTGLDATDDGGLLWKRQRAELRLPGLAVPEALGGQGLGVTELAIACEEAGRVLAGGPFFASACLAVSVVDRLGSGALRSRILAAIAGGATAALALREPGGEADPSQVRMRAVTGDDGKHVLTGAKADVLGALGADILLVIALGPGGVPALYSLEPGAQGVNIAPTENLDGSRPCADLRLDAAPAAWVGADCPDGDRFRAALDIARVCLAAESVGAAESCLERTVRYISDRRQFGQPVGAFQALQHRCADILVRVELARHGVRHAVSVLSGADGDPVLATSLAAAAALDAFELAAAEEIQMHGGLGFSWESDAHLYFRRSVVSASLLGTAQWHRRRIAERLAAG